MSKEASWSGMNRIKDVEKVSYLSLQLVLYAGVAEEQRFTSNVSGIGQ